MAVELRLIQTGMSMQVGTVVAWSKAVGDTVAKGEVIGEVESEKSTLEIVAPADGTLAQILVDAGTEVPVRTVLALIAAPGEALDAVRTPAPTSAAEVPPASTGFTAPTAPVGGAVTAGAAAGTQVTPAARRLAGELDVDLATVSGSGPGGRIVEADVRAHADSPAVRASGAPGSPPPGTTALIPLRGMRGTIARRMVESLHTMAQLTLTTEADVTDLVAAREEAKAFLRVTPTHLIVGACALALRKHPHVNAVIEGDQIHQIDDIHIGIAVQVGDGLVVPVLRNADQLNLRGIVAASAALVDEVREGRAEPDAFTGGTFTVTNLGAYGIDTFTPIVNPPQVAILGVGRVVERAARTDEALLVWRKAMSLSLTIDHRALDGAPAAEFLQTVVGFLEHPDVLFT